MQRREKDGASIVIIAIAILFIAIPVCSIVSRVSERSKCSVHMTGVVIENIEKEDSEDGTSYIPVIKYTYKDKEYKKRGDIENSLPMFKVGDEVEILVNPNNPSQMLIDLENIYSWIIMIVFIIIGVALGYGVFKKRD